MWKNVILVFVAFLISGCADFSLKRSANNKLVDAKGFHGGKRRPLYNKKYITQAKRNVKDGSYDDDYDSDENDEDTTPASRNRSIYRNMIDQERKKGASQGNYRRNDDMDYDEDYPRLSDAKKRSSAPDGKSEQEMRRELQEIKKMLSTTQKDMAKYRCPLSQQSPDSKDAQRPAPSPEYKQRTHSIASPDDE